MMLQTPSFQNLEQTLSLDLNFMLALDTVVREGSVAKAALRLHKAQSAVSYQIKQLEQQLGLDLLDRDGYRVKLTSAGEVVLNEGRRLLIQANQLEALARELNQEWEAKLFVIVDGILPLQTVLKGAERPGRRRCANAGTSKGRILAWRTASL